MEFADGTKVLDIGTGGGFREFFGILFPNVEFTLVDSIGKKITVVNAVAESLGLKNVKAYHERAEKIKRQIPFVVSRAVTQMPVFLRWLKGKLKKNNLTQNTTAFHT